MTVEIIAYFSSKCCFQVRETGWSAQLLKKIRVSLFSLKTFGRDFRRQIKKHMR